ncbi:U-box domain-containing protein 34, variant 2 [Balamuthia mandrillaris]
MVVPPRWILASAAEPQVDQCHPSLCPLANFCTLVSRYGAGKHFNTSVSLIVFHLIPAAYLLYWICWRFVHSYKQAIQGKLKIERQMTPLYATWMQVLCATRVTQLLLVVFAPVDPIASTLLDVTHVFTLFFLVLALIAFLYMSDFSDWRRVTAILMGVGLLALLFAFLWYTAMSASGSWVVYMYHPNSGWGGILFMGSAFVVTSLYLIFCCIPAFQEYAPRKAIRPFLILMVNTFAFSTILYIFIYIHYELTYCLWLLHELTNVLAFPWVYVWTLYSDSNYWHTRATQTPTDCEATPLLSRSIGEEWTISPSDLTLGPLLGKGSYGEVRQGTWHGIDVAVKTIYNVHFDKSRREEFTREVEILRRLHHPHIVLFLGAYAEPDFIIMTEYMERGNLYHVLHSDTPLTFSMKLQMIQHIARGMTYLHSHRLVHRGTLFIVLFCSCSLSCAVQRELFFVTNSNVFFQTSKV